MQSYDYMCVITLKMFHTFDPFGQVILYSFSWYFFCYDDYLFLLGKTVNVYAVIPKQGNLINDGLIWLACIHIDGDDFLYTWYTHTIKSQCIFLQVTYIIVCVYKYIYMLCYIIYEIFRSTTILMLYYQAFFSFVPLS